jgi:hypothetical protein
MESLARLVAIILGAALGSGIIAVFLWRKPPHNRIVRAVLVVLMLPVMCIGIFLASLSVGIGVRALGVAILIAAVLATKSMFAQKNLH